VKKPVVFGLIAVAAVACVAPASGQPDVTELPPGYRDWKVISVAHEAGDLNDLRAVLGNDIAIKAYRDGKLPFPDGAVIARLAWNYEPSAENDKVFGRPQSFVAGAPKEGVQFMVKDSRKYASTGGWGFEEFVGGEPLPPAALAGCFSCHAPATAHDDVFTPLRPLSRDRLAQFGHPGPARVRTREPGRQGVGEVGRSRAALGVREGDPAPRAVMAE
jgi:Cytochrome P460